jgi:large subunit ribosomal protein L35
MPKLKTHSGTKDRVVVTKNGKVRTKKSYRNHFLQKKSGARKRKLAGLITLTGANSKTAKLKIGA